MFSKDCWLHGVETAVLGGVTNCPPLLPVVLGVQGDGGNVPADDVAGDGLCDFHVEDQFCFLKSSVLDIINKYS